MGHGNHHTKYGRDQIIKDISKSAKEVANKISAVIKASSQHLHLKTFPISSDN